MVQKISSTPSVTPTDRVSPALAQPSSSGSGPKNAAAAPAPSAQVHLSEASQASAAMQTAAVDDPLDAQLIQEIRQRIDTGKFQIDFDEVAANILREAIASTQGSRR